MSLLFLWEKKSWCQRLQPASSSPYEWGWNKALWDKYMGSISYMLQHVAWMKRAWLYSLTSSPSCNCIADSCRHQENRISILSSFFKLWIIISVLTGSHWTQHFYAYQRSFTQRPNWRKGKKKKYLQIQWEERLIYNFLNHNEIDNSITETIR